MNPLRIPGFVVRGLYGVVVGTLETVVATVELVAMYRSFTTDKLMR